MATSSGRVRALGTHVDALTLVEAGRRVVDWLAEPEFACRYVVTPNLDHAVLLRDNEQFRAAYDQAALVLPDGMPLLWAARLNGSPLPERVAGSDLGPFVLAQAPQGTRVFLLGASDEASQRAQARIERDWPQLDVVGRLSPPFGFENSTEWSNAIVEAISGSRAQLVVVGFGAPKQEIWVHAHRHRLPSTVVLCLGATIDFLAGLKLRAPVWMQTTGLEWLHRAGTEPRRLLGRYIKDGMRLPGLLYLDALHRRATRKR